MTFFLLGHLFYDLSLIFRDSFVKMSKRDISQLNELDRPTSNANIHGAITSISPIKKGRKSSFFEAMIADHTSQVRLVGFNNQQQIQLRDLHVKKSPVKISNCQIKTSRRGLGFDILLKTDSMISKSSVGMDIDKIVIPQDEPQNITLNELPTLDQYTKVSVNIKVLKVLSPVEVGSDKKKKQDIHVADKTAATTVVLWEEHIGSLQEEQSYNLSNFIVKEFQSKKHLSIPNGNFSISSISMVETNVSALIDDENTTILDVRIVGVSRLDEYSACMTCAARVEPLTPPLGKCTSIDCQMIQVYDLCKTQVSAKVLLRFAGDDGAVDHVACSAYGEIVNQLANLPSNHTVTVKELLMAKPISQIDYITNKKIIVVVVHQV